MGHTTTKCGLRPSVAWMQWKEDLQIAPFQMKMIRYIHTKETNKKYRYHEGESLSIYLSFRFHYGYENGTKNEVFKGKPKHYNTLKKNYKKIIE